MKRIFISYDYEIDRNFVRSIGLIAKNPNIKFDFYNESVSEKIESSNSEYVKQQIKEKISRASVVLCIVGKNTNLSKWVKWEIEKARDMDKKIIFMRRKDDYTSHVSFKKNYEN